MTERDTLRDFNPIIWTGESGILTMEKVLFARIAEVSARTSAQVFVRRGRGPANPFFERGFFPGSGSGDAAFTARCVHRPDRPTACLSCVRPAGMSP